MKLRTFTTPDGIENKKIVKGLNKKSTFKQMTVSELKRKLNDFDENEEIYMCQRVRNGTEFTAINFIGYDKNNNLIITLDDDLLV